MPGREPPAATATAEARVKLRPDGWCQADNLGYPPPPRPGGTPVTAASGLPAISANGRSRTLPAVSRAAVAAKD